MVEYRFLVIYDEIDDLYCATCEGYDDLEYLSPSMEYAVAGIAFLVTGRNEENDPGDEDAN